MSSRPPATAATTAPAAAVGTSSSPAAHTAGRMADSPPGRSPTHGPPRSTNGSASNSYSYSYPHNTTGDAALARGSPTGGKQYNEPYHVDNDSKDHHSHHHSNSGVQWGSTLRPPPPLMATETTAPGEASVGSSASPVSRALPETTLRGPGRSPLVAAAASSFSTEGPQQRGYDQREGGSARPPVPSIDSSSFQQQQQQQQRYADPLAGPAAPPRSSPTSSLPPSQQQQHQQQREDGQRERRTSGTDTIPDPPTIQQQQQRRRQPRANGPPLSSSASVPPPPLTTTSARPNAERSLTGGNGGATVAPQTNQLSACPSPPPPSSSRQQLQQVPPPPPQQLRRQEQQYEATAAPATAPPPASDVALARPATALSTHIVALYKSINTRYYSQRRLALPGLKYNNGFDDKDGHYIVVLGEEILNRYTVQEMLGKGSFGTVLRCRDEKRHENVALKVTRHGSNFRSQAKLEADILLKLNDNPKLEHLVVKLLKVFDWQGHLVLVFKLLSFNLYQLIKCTEYKGVSLELVRKFAYQLVCTLLQLEQQRPRPIIHCDVKPENVLLHSHNRSGIRLIDFGSACYADRCVHKYIQSRFYRCPEVILYLGYTTAIDRWSLGCVLVELHTGLPLFGGHTEAAQLANFEATLGPLPADMIERSAKASKLYERQPDGTWRLREAALPRRSLESVIGVTTGGPGGSRKGTPGHDVAAYREFHDFIQRLLAYHPEERISCEDALSHAFLAPLYLSDQKQRYARRQHPQQPQQGPPSGSGAAAPVVPAANENPPRAGAA